MGQSCSDNQPSKFPQLSEQYNNIIQLHLNQLEYHQITQLDTQQNKQTGAIYQGQLQNKLFHGKGRILEANKTYSQGEFVNGFINGSRCLKIYPDRKYFIGKISGDEQEGRLQYLEHPELSSYQGKFRKDVPHGRGILIYRNGNKYEGNFNNGVKEGQGRSIHPDTTVEGTFLNNQIICGKIFKNRQLKYQGQIRAGKMHGKGKYYKTGGCVYQGNFVNGKIHGYGKLTFPDGSYYQGNFEDDLQHGTGLVKEGNNIREGQWNRGNLIRWISNRTII